MCQGSVAELCQHTQGVHVSAPGLHVRKSQRSELCQQGLGVVKLLHFEAWWLSNPCKWHLSTLLQVRMPVPGQHALPCFTSAIIDAPNSWENCCFSPLYHTLQQACQQRVCSICLCAHQQWRHKSFELLT